MASGSGSNHGVFENLASWASQFARWLRFNWMYLGNPPWDTGVSPPELMDFIHSHPPGTAIDLGCGTGTNLLALGKAGWHVTGVEFVPAAAIAARKKLRKAGIVAEVRSGDVARLDVVQGAFDLALDVGCYHGLTEFSRASYRDNLLEIINPGGYFLMYAHWQAEGQNKRVGIKQTDFEAFQQSLALESRQDSQDRWGRQATWMLFKR